jgi:intein/homing endonuclease/phage portal protein BeeE
LDNKIDTADWLDWTSKVTSWQDMTKAIPRLVREDISKGRMKIEDAARGVKALQHDPLAVQYAMGYKDRKYSLTYDVLKRIPHQLSFVGGIINVRVNQVAAFSTPFRASKSVGFVVKHKDPSHLTSKSEQKFIKEMESFIYNCGHSEPNPHNNKKRDDFETFLKKIVRDSLIYDQACALPGSWVELADGTGCKIEDMQKGMQVRTHLGVVRTVLNPTQRLYSGDLVTIAVRGQRLSVTGGHPVLVSRKVSCKGNTVELSEPEWTVARDLTEDHYVVYPIYTDVGEDQERPIFADRPRKYSVGPFDELVQIVGCHSQTAYKILTGSYSKKGPVKDLVLRVAEDLGVSYKACRTQEASTVLDEQWGGLIGLYLAKGNVRENSVAFTFHEDEKYLVRFVKEFGRRYGITSTDVVYDDRAAVTVILNSTALSRFLSAACGTGSENKRVPQCMRTSPKAVRRELIKYYLLGDGCVRSNRVTFSTISRDLFTGIRSLLSSEGIYVAECTNKDKYLNHAISYGGSLGGPEYRVLAEGLGLLTDHSVSCRKSCHKKGDNLYVKISSLSSSGVEGQPVYNIEVEDDHSYIMEGFVNHNCFEIVPDRRGQPYEFVAVDAATVRLAASNSVYGPNDTYHARQPAYSGRLLQHMLDQERGPYRSMQMYGQDAKTKASFVQIINGQIENVYTDREMAFGVRNPRTDIYIQGYGYSELEQLITVITSHLYAEEYNRRFFMQGSAPKGILNFKGDQMTPDMLEGFKRQWRASLEGVENSWRTPILQSEAGLEWIDLHPTNREMEYSAWVEYLIKVTCAVFLMDPAELNFDLHGGVQQTPLFESSQEWKLKASRDRGLKPLLRFIAKMINEHIVSNIDDHFVFDFIGLDELTEQEKHTLRTEQVSSYLTLNEVRRSDDLDDLEYGDMPMNPTYLQAMQIKMQMEQQKQQMEQAQQASAGGVEAGGEGEGGAPASGAGSQEEPAPDYTDRFEKSLHVEKGVKFLEIDLELDHWKDAVKDGVS